MNKPLTILILQLAEDSFDEALMIPRIIAQFPPQSKFYVMINSVSSSFVTSIAGLFVSLMTENQDHNLHDFQVIFQHEQLDAIILLDLQKHFVAPADLNFLPLWLDDPDVPILAIDYFNLMEYKSDRLQLKAGIEDKSTEALNISPYLLKPYPPIYPFELSGDLEKVFLWNPINSDFKVAQENMREQLRKSFNLSEEDKIVSVVIDPLLFLKAIEVSLIGFFMILIEVIIYYLRGFPNTRFQILLVGLFPPNEETNNIPNVNLDLTFFSHLTEDNYLTVLAGSDLVLTNSDHTLLLLDTMVAGVPTIVMANSVIQELNEDQTRTIRSYFQPSPVLYDFLNMMVDLNQWTSFLPIFQFINYPAPNNEISFPEPGLHYQGLMYHIIDLFDDQTTEPILEKLLFDQEYLNNYRNTINKVLQNEQSLYLSQILARITQK
jgi:hypothetical protein